MDDASTQRLRIAIDGASSVSAVLCAPSGPVEPWAGYVFAHGAGAGMEHGFMASFANGLAERGIATLRYQFPYMVGACSSRSDAQTLEAMLDTMATWARARSDQPLKPSATAALPGR